MPSGKGGIQSRINAEKARAYAGFREQNVFSLQIFDYDRLKTAIEYYIYFYNNERFQNGIPFFAASNRVIHKKGKEHLPVSISLLQTSFFYLHDREHFNSQEGRFRRCSPTYPRRSRLYERRSAGYPWYAYIAFTQQPVVGNLYSR